jgi:DNA-nicking Smr family endonuclease
MRRRKDREPTEAELALWAAVARHVRPLPGRPPLVEAPEPVLAAPAPAPSELPAKPMAASPVPASPKKAASPPPLAPLDRRLRTRLRRGREQLEGVIDLHGMRQDEAHGALVGFLEQSSARGARLVLVVTGKGGQGADRGQGSFHERGVLRRNVPHWLRMAELRQLVVGFEEAEARHGGAGALYVRLRRRGPDSQREEWP